MRKMDSLYTDATLGRQIKIMDYEMVRTEYISNELYSVRMNNDRLQVEAKTFLISPGLH